MNRRWKRPGPDWFKVEVHLLDTKTNERRTYATWEFSDDGEWADYNWSGGNFRCDCNRELFFGYAIGLPYTHSDTRSCSEGRYRVEAIKSCSTGNILYAETE